MTEKTTRAAGVPTEKMIAAGKAAADRHGVPLPADFDTNYDVAKQFLDEYLGKPSPKAISFAERLAKDAGIELPAALLTDARQLSAWIDEHKRK